MATRRIKKGTTIQGNASGSSDRAKARQGGVAPKKQAQSNSAPQAKAQDSPLKIKGIVPNKSITAEHPKLGKKARF